MEMVVEAFKKSGVLGNGLALIGVPLSFHALGERCFLFWQVF